MVELAGDVKSMTTSVTEEVEHSLDAVSRSLREASLSAMELSEDACTALSNAASEVMRVAEMLRKNSLDTAKGMARQAAKEVHDHPLASIAAALTAVGALASVIVATRSRRAA